MKHKEQFRVAISGAFKNQDGTPVFPMFDLAPLSNDRAIEFEYVAGVDLERFDANSIPTSNRLTLIARFGVGFDTVDVEACTINGIAVGITPNGVRRPVAASILTYILALSGRLMVKDALVRGGPSAFAERTQHMGTGLVGKTLGSIGLGNIGTEVFRLCAPLDMKFIAHDPFIDPTIAKSANVELKDLDSVFRESDFLTINVPLGEETHHLVNSARLTLMKPTAYLINTSRGPVVDQTALVTALTQGVIAGAGLDVFDPIMSFFRLMLYAGQTSASPA